MSEIEKYGEKINELRAKLKENDKSNSEPTDEFLLRYLCFKNFDVEDSLKTLTELYKFNNEYRNISIASPSKLANLFNSLMIGISPKTTNKGRFIFFIRFEPWNTSKMSITEVMQSAYLILLELSKYKSSQDFGADVIIDVKGLTMKHLMKFGITQLLIMEKIFQKSIPYQVLDAHFIKGDSFLFKALYAILAPVFKILKLNIYTWNDYTALKEFYGSNSAADFLPEFFEGNVPAEDVNSYYENEMKNRDEEFSKITNLGVINK